MEFLSQEKKILNKIFQIEKFLHLKTKSKAHLKLALYMV